MERFSVKERLRWVWIQAVHLPVLWFVVQCSVVLYMCSVRQVEFMAAVGGILILILCQVILLRLGWVHFAVGLLCICVALWRGTVAWEQQPALSTTAVSTVVGRIVQVDSYTATSARYTIQTYQNRKRGPRIQVRALPYPWYVAGDTVAISCQLRAISAHNAYLVHKNILYTCSQALLRTAHADQVPQSWWWRLVWVCSEAIAKSWSRVRELVAYPAADLLFSITIGLPIDIHEYEELLRSAGLSHIVSVSGYNLSVVAGMFVVMLPRHWRLGRSVGILMLLTCFTIASGFGAPVTRAAVMMAWLMAGAWCGRSSSVYNSLCWSVVLSLLGNPYELFSISLYLSVLALLGVIVFGPVGKSLLLVVVAKGYRRIVSSRLFPYTVKERYRYPFESKDNRRVQDIAIWQTLSATGWRSVLHLLVRNTIELHNVFKWVRPLRWLFGLASELVIPTMAASVATSGLIAFLFKSFSVWFLLGNLAVLPLVGVLTVVGIVIIGLSLTSFTWSMVGAASFVWSSWVYFACQYIIEVSEYISHLPFAQVSISVNFGLTAVYYIVLGLLAIILYPLPRRA